MPEISDRAHALLSTMSFKDRLLFVQETKTRTFSPAEIKRLTGGDLLSARSFFANRQKNTSAPAGGNGPAVGSVVGTSDPSRG